MLLAFHTKSLRDICESQTKAKASYGDNIAESLKHRLADLSAATAIFDLVASPPIILDDPTHMVVELPEGYRILLVANHPNNPTLVSGEVDWSKVTRVKIMRIEQL